MPALGNNGALSFQIKAKCNVCKARSSVMSLLHCEVDTPVFMPVGTQVGMFISR
jgi:tRNA-guanine family transglycosylase